MRVTPTDLETIRTAVTPLDTDARREVYRRWQFPRAELVRDIDRRYRWDLYWAAVREGNSLPDSTHGYNDSHIDTALRAIVPVLEGVRTR